MLHDNLRLASVEIAVDPAKVLTEVGSPIVKKVLDHCGLCGYNSSRTFFPQRYVLHQLFLEYKGLSCV
ncbi:hypothetical protein GWI33_005915 [Rhynchophorus ferrugineus]|uniref:Uncharacterized protein n=1 Tax=Rhynchophorus ferrugineus TaxID=354439 RepID=A0A834MLY5_RHYFE|nr:hypothetical protein GWI33_005915 [Rhynchophorus ferrugineus]